MTISFTLVVSLLLLCQPCPASFFEATLEKNSIYTPSTMNLSIKLTNNARIEGDYRFNVSIYIAETLMRRWAMPATKKGPVELEFPAVRSKTDVRCRIELFLNGQFIESKGIPLTLWPPIDRHLGDLTSKKVIWVFDISGRLREFFKSMKVETVNATFQAARDFKAPDIVFIGEQTNLSSMKIILHSLAPIENKPVVIFLRQKQLLENTLSEILLENDYSQKVICDINSPVLTGLSKRDIIKILDGTMCVKIRKGENEDISINSYVTEKTKDKRYVYTYLCTIRHKEEVMIHCQLPVMNNGDPRCAVLLNNLLGFAEEICNSQRDQSDQ
ncbi:MAG: hypothetical protein ACYS91_01240 [Planctomycetota bacterium]|jgi:hypothetical protein